MDQPNRSVWAPKSAGSFHELKKLHRRTVNQDERHQDALGWTVRRYQQLLAFESGVEIVDFERDMRDRFDHLRQGALWLESHPLNAERIPLVIRAEQPVLLEVRLPGPFDGRRDADVMILPQWTTSEEPHGRSNAPESVRRRVR